jgi:hypothetical protein
MPDMTRLLIVGFVLLCFNGEVWADKRIAVAAVEGDKNGAVAKIIVAALDGEGDLIVISPKAVTKVADELAIAIDDRQSGKLMEELEADALVISTVEPITGGNKLTLRIVPKGARKSRSAVVLYGKKANGEKIRSGIRNAVTTILEKAASVAPPDEVEEDGPTTLSSEEGDPPSSGGRAVPKRAITGGTGKSDKRFVSFKEDKGPDAEVTKGEGDDEGDGEGGEGAGGSDEKDDGAKKKAAPRRVVAARISAGPSILTRTLQFSHRAFAQAPKDYSNSPVPGVRVQGEVYPLAFGSRGLLSNLGLAFELDQTFGLKVNAGGMKLPTTVRHFSVGARIRVPIGGGEVAVVGGYGQRTFVVSRGGVMLDLPDIDYKYFDPGVAFRVPVGPVALFGDARVLLLTNAGQIQTNASYGPGDVSAFDVEAGLEVAISRSVAVKLAGDFVAVGYDFAGTGELSKNRDADPTTVDVGGAAERYIGGALTVVIAY